MTSARIQHDDSRMRMDIAKAVLLTYGTSAFSLLFVFLRPKQNARSSSAGAMAADFCGVLHYKLLRSMFGLLSVSIVTNIRYEKT